DFTPQSVGNWNSTEFDFPDLAMTDSSLHLTLNVYGHGNFDNRWGHVTLRFDLDQMAAYQQLTYRLFTSVTDHGGIQGLRGTRGATDAMDRGPNRATGQNASFRVYKWKDGETQVTFPDAPITAWRGGGAVARGPDGLNWLGRSDGRLTAAWQSGDKIGF